MQSLPSGLLIAAPRSGSGKTTLVLGLLRALARRDIIVQPMKCGPDYIDPSFHAAAAARISYNLDSWAMRPDLIDTLVGEAGRGAELFVGEALMGLFDGVAKDGASGDGSSSGIAARQNWPVLLVLDISGQSQSAGAVAKGFASFRPDVRIAGVVLNKVASPRHEALARKGIEEAGLPVVGALPRQPDLALPERHLGLVQAEETAELDRRLEALADFVETHCDIGAIVSLASPTTPPAQTGDTGLKPPGQRIALARDAAFSFIYPHLLTGWQRQGAEILPFSPLADEGPSDDADVAWLPGGYPELHGTRLATNTRFQHALRRFAETRPVHGECGGYMVLGHALIDAEGTAHRMTGLLDLETSFAKRKMNLGYRLAELKEDCVLGPRGSLVRGHEFHYSTTIRNGDRPLFEVVDANGNPLGALGGRRGRVTGSFFHVIDRG
ncbi:hydrogenobyrinate a,c-diamide synthase [Labrys miyagiensis]|uniref:Hydrogenobyrinate a,c-diamide synthase n=1 Tax=Labrys miyagiensis TaxID=346912 RepID=A0ABQ6CVP5_9HYPH|nr:cobyrinate a,c-diamide synthase [Labrys miyagiensis]GLS23050.1 hydrogenobyrinate a,c-diamide synthase [Labrys miyagiensis]